MVLTDHSLIRFVCGPERLRRDCAYSNIYFYTKITSLMDLVCGLDQAHSFILHVFYMYVSRDDCGESAFKQIYNITFILNCGASCVWF